MPKTKEIRGRSVWISDLHLGSCGTRHKELIDFLDALYCDTLYLNGDILDKWLINNPKRSSSAVSEVIKKINQLKEREVSLVFCAGNHDRIDDISRFFPKVPVYEELIYTSLNGKKYLVFHGHSIDTFNDLKFKPIAWFGTFFYECLLFFRRNKKSSSSFSRRVKIGIKAAANALFFYDRRLKNLLEKKNVDGVIYAHTHQPKHKFISNKEYLNSGDWIDNCSYIIETHDGQFDCASFK